MPTILHGDMEIRLTKCRVVTLHPAITIDESGMLQIYSAESVVLVPGETRVVNSGWDIQLPRNRYLEILPVEWPGQLLQQIGRYIFGYNGPLVCAFHNNTPDVLRIVSRQHIANGLLYVPFDGKMTIR